jgi:hypothetical protein
MRADGARSLDGVRSSAFYVWRATLMSPDDPAIITRVIAGVLVNRDQLGVRL